MKLKTALAELRYLSLPIVAYGIQVISVNVLTVAVSTQLSKMGIAISYLLLAAFVLANRRHLAVQFIGLGLLLNFIAILANSGFMPVTVETAIASGHQEKIAHVPLGTTIPMTMSVLLERSATNLWFLTDIFAIRWPVGYMFSVGDVFIAIGVTLLIGQVLVSCLQRYAKRSPMAECESKALPTEDR